jgi:hypothetical protein
MSWSLNGITNLSVEDAFTKLEEINAPASIKDYITAGIDGLSEKYGDDVKVTVTGSGHLCEDSSSADPTTATIEVRKGE